MSVREGVEIDYCPTCRGVWLDRGELDKLIDRSAAQEAQRAHPATTSARRPDFVDSDYGKSAGRQQHRRKSWLSDIFD
jgi:Zn-finger nucleic acid-binding protein